MSELSDSPRSFIWSRVELRYATLGQLEKIRKRIEKFEKKYPLFYAGIQMNLSPKSLSTLLSNRNVAILCMMLYKVHIFMGGTSLNDPIGKILKAEA